MNAPSTRPLAITATSAVLRATARISPKLAGRLAFPLFMHVGRRAEVRRADRATHEAAERGTVRIPGIDGRGVDVVTYTWGSGAETVFVAHGWQSRASIFATLIRELTGEGYRVIGFDSPANGASPGSHTTLFDHLDVLRELQHREGAPRAVVGHSFGALAALLAPHHGLEPTRIVSIAAGCSIGSFVDEFCALLELDRSTRNALATTFASRLVTADVDPFELYSAERHPLDSNSPLLLVHDTDDRRIPIGESRRVHAVNPHSRFVETTGFGHNRVLRADATLDAVVEFITASDEFRSPRMRDAVTRHTRSARTGTTQRPRKPDMER